MLYGILDYKNEKYIYKLEENVLCMERIEDIGKNLFISEYNQNSFEEEYLKGINAENGNYILFKTLGKINIKNTKLQIKIQYYVELEEDVPISKLSFMGDEINYIYNIAQGIESYGLTEEGMASCKTKNVDETTSPIEYFNVENKEVGIYFTIYRGINFQSCYPLNLYSSINLKVDANKDYDFLVHLCYIVKNFLSFLCYRKNIHFNEIILYTQDLSKKYKKIGKISLMDEYIKEDTKIIKKRNITYEAIKGNIGNILQDIENERLYLRHIPDSHKDSLKMDYSKFIMTTAAIEWIFRNLYPQGLKHSDKTLKAQEKVREELKDKIAISTGEIKKQYKFLQRLVGSDSLSQKIVQICNDYDIIIKPMGEYLYNLNNLIEEFNYVKIGSRIEKERNNFAHGNIDKDFDYISILDLTLLERIIYILQLSEYKIEQDKILEQVKRLFGNS